MGKFIDKDKFRAEGEDRIEVHLRNLHVLVLDHLTRNDIEALHQCFGLDPPMGLDVPDPYINAVTLPVMGGLQHLVGLTDPCDVPQENFEFAPVLLPLFTLDTGKERIGIRATFRKSNHRYLHSYENEQDINQLYPDERSDKPTDPIDEDVIAKRLFCRHCPVADSAKCERD